VRTAGYCWTVRHKAEKYGKAALSKTVELVLFQKSAFDIDVSFPAGLVVKKLSDMVPALRAGHPGPAVMDAVPWKKFNFLSSIRNSLPSIP